MAGTTKVNSITALKGIRLLLGALVRVFEGTTVGFFEEGLVDGVFDGRKIGFFEEGQAVETTDGSMEGGKDDEGRLIGPFDGA